MSAQLLAASRALLDARECRMITRIEWEALVRAVAEATPALDDAKVYKGFLEVWSDTSLGAAMAALAAQGVTYTERAGG